MANLRKGTVKVMHGRNGSVRIQEDMGDTIKVYSLDEWNAELAKRAEQAEKPTQKETKTLEPKLGATKKVAIKKVEKA